MSIILLLLSSTIIMIFLSKFYNIPNSLIWLVILLALLILDYAGDFYDAKYINAKYNTNYTSEDLFWHRQYIEKELKIDKKCLDN